MIPRTSTAETRPLTANRFFHEISAAVARLFSQALHAVCGAMKLQEQQKAQNLQIFQKNVVLVNNWNLQLTVSGKADSVALEGVHTS
jgi:hypothetical protein